MVGGCLWLGYVGCLVAHWAGEPACLQSLFWLSSDAALCKPA
jgi:hypothetical protein